MCSFSILQEYDNYKKTLENCFYYAIGIMGINIPQAFYYTEDGCIECTESKPALRLVQYIGLLSVGLTNGFVVTRDTKDGDKLLNNIADSLVMHQDELHELIYQQACSSLISDYELILDKYKNELCS